MDLSAEAIVAVVGVVIALPPTALALWNCRRRSRMRRERQQETMYAMSPSTTFRAGAQGAVLDPMFPDGYMLRGQFDIYVQKEQLWQQRC